MSRLSIGGGFRARLTVTIIVLVMATAVLLSIGSFLLVRSALRGQLVDDAIARVQFSLFDLLPAEGLAGDLDRVTFEESGLTDRFLRRGATGVYVDFGDEDPYASRPDLLETPTLVSPELGRHVDDGRYGYEFVDVDGDPRLVVAARRPGTDDVFYFFADASVVGSAAAELARYLAVAGAVVVVLAALTAGTVARGVLRPIGAAGLAARRIAAGELDARVEVVSEDEFGRLAETFNQMAESLQRQVAELEDAEDRERRFVADVSHELRTPLTGLWNEAQLLASSLDQLSGAGRRAAELLVVDVARLRRLVDELLEISRLDADAGRRELRSTDIGLLLEALIADRHPDALLLGGLPGAVTCDRRGLERVVANLLDNAAIHAAGAETTVRYGLDGDQLVVTVEDAGPGIDREMLPHLFDRFFKADPSRQGGSGLGLAIAHRHARQMGGDLTGELRPGGGLVFRLVAPVTTPLHADAVVDTSMPHADGEE